jgi:hypothetical protein
MDRLRTHAGAIVGAGLAVAALATLWVEAHRWIDKQEALRVERLDDGWKKLGVAVEEMDGQGLWHARESLFFDAQMTNDRSSVGGPVYELLFAPKAVDGKWSLSRIVSARCGGEELVRMEMDSPKSAIGWTSEWSCGEKKWRFSVAEEKSVKRPPVANSMVPMPTLEP